MNLSMHAHRHTQTDRHMHALLGQPELDCSVLAITDGHTYRQTGPRRLTLPPHLHCSWGQLGPATPPGQTLVTACHPF